MHIPKRLILVTTLYIVLGGLAGCGHESAATQEIRSAASTDLACDPSVIEFVKDAPMEKQVAGCGRELTYMYKCNPAPDGGQDCRWKAVPVKGDP